MSTIRNRAVKAAIARNRWRHTTGKNPARPRLPTKEREKHGRGDNTVTNKTMEQIADKDCRNLNGARGTDLELCHNLVTPAHCRSYHQNVVKPLITKNSGHETPPCCCSAFLHIHYKSDLAARRNADVAPSW